MFESEEMYGYTEEEVLETQTQIRLIFAPSGYGKSCFCEFAIYQWSKDVIWNEYELVLLITAKRINQMDNNELLMTLLNQSIIFNNVVEEHLSLDYIKNLAKRKKLLVIIDGIDEIVNFPDEISEDMIRKAERDLYLTKDDPSLSGFQSVIVLLLGQLLPGSKLILTTRNYNMKCLLDFCVDQKLFFQNIRILPLEEEDVFEYIHRMNHKNNDFEGSCGNKNCEKTIQLLKRNFNLLKLCSNPSWCMIVGMNSNVLSRETDKHMSTTSLITRFIMNTLVEHGRLKTMRSLFMGLSPFYKKTFKNISHMAYNMFLTGERVAKGTYRLKEHCQQCQSEDYEIILDTILFECANKLRALGFINIDEDNIKNVTCGFGQEIALLRDYFAAAYIVCQDKSISDISKFITKYKHFKSKRFSQFAYLNIRFDDILPIIASMLFSDDILTKAFLEMLDNENSKTELTKEKFYADMTKLKSESIKFIEKDGVFRITDKQEEQIFGSINAQNLSKCAFESQSTCFDKFKTPGIFYECLVQIIFLRCFTFHYIFETIFLENCEYRIEILPEIGLAQPMLYFSWIQHLQSFTIGIVLSISYC